MSHAFLNAYRASYARARGICDDYASAHASAATSLATAVNALERLPALERASEDVMSSELRQHAVESQYVAIDDALVRCREACERCEAATRALESVAKDAWRRAHAVDPPLRRAGGERLGPHPSVAECVCGLEDLWRMHRDECAVKAETSRRVATTRDADDLNQLLRIFTAQGNLDPAVIKEILDRVPVKSVDAATVA